MRRLGRGARERGSFWRELGLGVRRGGEGGRRGRGRRLTEER
jgi:hypothetical protein